MEESRGDQFVLSNILPARMSQLDLYRGYRWLVEQLYDFTPYRRRTLDFLLRRGHQAHAGLNMRRGDLGRLARILWATLFRDGPRRAAFTLALLAETALRRPSVIKEAVSFAIVHQAFHAYVLRLGAELDRAILELGAGALERPERSRGSPSP